jgi:hypothetical protein
MVKSLRQFLLLNFEF